MPDRTGAMSPSGSGEELHRTLCSGVCAVGKSLSQSRNQLDRSKNVNYPGCGQSIFGGSALSSRSDCVTSTAEKNKTDCRDNRLSGIKKIEEIGAAGFELAISQSRAFNYCFLNTCPAFLTSHIDSTKVIRFSNLCFHFCFHRSSIFDKMGFCLARFGIKTIRIFKKRLYGAAVNCRLSIEAFGDTICGAKV